MYLITEKNDLRDVVSFPYAWSFRSVGQSKPSPVTIFHIPQLTCTANNATTQASAVAEIGPDVLDNCMVTQDSNADSEYDRESDNEGEVDNNWVGDEDFQIPYEEEIVKGWLSNFFLIGAALSAYYY